jgi:hypothetical protein
MVQADPGSISCAMPVTPMDGASGPPMHALSLESVLFPEPASQLPEASGGTPPTNRSARPLDMVQLLDGDFVNTTCGASLGAMETGVIPHSPDNFVRLMSKPLQSRPLASPPPIHRQHQHRVYSTSEMPRRSSHLAKKAKSHVPDVAGAQNLLMHKLGLALGPHVESEDFDRYVQAFKNGLSAEQVNLIRELFKEQADGPVDHPSPKRWR